MTINWEKAEGIAKIFSLIFLPIVLAIGGWLIQKGISSTATNQQYVNLAITILGNENEYNPLRNYAVDLLKKKSPIEIDENLEKQLRSGELMLPKILSDFDEKAFKFMTSGFEDKLNRIYWPPIKQKYDEYKLKEGAAKKALTSDPDNLALFKEYREYGIAAEYIVRLGYAGESNLRRESLKMFIETRQKMEETAFKKETESTFKNFEKKINELFEQ